MSAIKRLIDHFGSANKTAQTITEAGYPIHRQTVDYWVRMGFIPFNRGMLIEKVTDGEISATSVYEDAAKARHHGHGL